MVLGNVGDQASQDAAYILNFHLPGIGVEFLLGALAWRTAQIPLHKGWRVLLVLAGLTAWWALAVLFGQLGDAGINGMALKGQMGALAGMCFALMVAGTLGLSPVASSPAMPQACWWRSAALWAGRLSYGVYLFHTAALQWVQPWRDVLEVYFPLGHQGLAVLATLLLAGLCHRLWEEPWRQFGRKKAAQMGAT